MTNNGNFGAPMIRETMQMLHRMMHGGKGGEVNICTALQFYEYSSREDRVVLVAIPVVANIDWKFHATMVH